MHIRTFPALIAATFCATLASGATIGEYQQTNLVSDIPGLAAHTDPTLINPWGIASSSSSPFWVSENGTGTSTLYNSSGTKLSLTVTIPGPGGSTSAPTGQVFNGSTAFNSDVFIFATEDGTVNGWRGSLGTTAETLIDNSAANAVYKGIAIASTGQGTYLYAADFHNDQILVTPSAGSPALSGNFTDPNIPAGYAPFNIQNIGNQLYVTYALQNAAKHDDVPGAGHGFIDVYDLQGNFIQRFASNGALDSPWGLALAPSTFGAAAGDLLVGNFGDGRINAYDLAGNFVGTLANVDGTALTNDGLWGLRFGNGGNGGFPDTLYVTAGLNGEADGLFAQVNAVPEPGTLLLLGAGIGAISLGRLRMRRS